MWSDVKSIIDRHHHFLITTHVHPDGDGIGAAIALAELLKTMHKQVRVVLDSPLPKRYIFLDQTAVYETFSPAGNYNEAEVLIVLDTHRKERIGRLASLMDSQYEMVVLCIDHHPITETFTPFVVIDDTACSVGAMIFDLYEELECELNLISAMSIYASIMCDTGRFSYGSTGRMAHKIADECLRLGVDPDFMHSRLFQSVTFPQLKMVVRAMQKMEIYFDNRVVFLQIDQRDYADLEGDLGDIDQIDFEFVHEFNKSITGIECVILMTEEVNHKIRISARSKKEVDVGDMMQALGGGGHRYAAGATVTAPLFLVKEKLLQLLEACLIKSIVQV